MLFLERKWNTVRKHRDIKLATTDTRRNKLVSEPNNHTTKCFSEKLLAIEMKKTKVKMNKYIYLSMSILDISKTLDFGVIMLNLSIKKKQNYVTWILTALLFILKWKIFIMTLIMILKNGLTHQTIINIPIDINKKKNMVFSKMN